MNVAANILAIVNPQVREAEANKQSVSYMDESPHAQTWGFCDGSQLVQDSQTGWTASA